MSVFAEIALVVTLCTSSGGIPAESCNNEAPESWTSASVAEASQDWQACKRTEAAYLARPGVSKAVCRYTRYAGSAVHE